MFWFDGEDEGRGRMEKEKAQSSDGWVELGTYSRAVGYLMSEQTSGTCIGTVRWLGRYLCAL